MCAQTSLNLNPKAKISTSTHTRLYLQCDSPARALIVLPLYRRRPSGSHGGSDAIAFRSAHVTRTGAARRASRSADTAVIPVCLEHKLTVRQHNVDCIM